jgi:hypothetical protein
LVTFFGQKLRQKSAKLAKMRNKKPLSEYQKERLGAAIEALQNPIFSTKSPDNNIRTFLLKQAPLRHMPGVLPSQNFVDSPFYWYATAAAKPLPIAGSTLGRLISVLKTKMPGKHGKVLR